MRCPVPSVTQVTDIVWYNTWLNDLKVERIYYNTLTCSTTCTLTGNPTYIWYKNRQLLDESTSPSTKTQSPVTMAIVTPVLYPVGDGSYFCVRGERVTLRCRTQCIVGLNPTYIWYKNGQSLTNPVTSYNSLILDPVTSYNSLILDPVSSEDAGNYSCAVEGLERILSPEETLTVRYGPKNTSVSVSPSGEIVEGSSVTLTCSSDANPPVDKYTWYKKNVTSPKASGQSYNITNISSEDRGEYYCEAQNGRGSMNSSALMIIVAGKQTSVLTAAVGIIVVVLVLILCLSGLMWFRKKNSTSTSNTRDTADDGQGDSSPVYDNISNMAMNSTAAQTESTYDQDDVHYASVHFSRSKTRKCLCTPPSSCFSPRNRMRMSSTLL
ncbi:sialoadhesin-like [Oncorhynchus keta]|uniref:sialoadhesin-like n=1 Tax=Oncorhynchus keta TaxID=8018 RepID=UPI00227A0879|nr:sialoadhesin-like [Oncorhynchus keta]